MCSSWYKGLLFGKKLVVFITIWYFSIHGILFGTNIDLLVQMGIFGYNQSKLVYCMQFF